MEKNLVLTRREALCSLGVGLVAMGVGALGPRALGEESVKRQAPQPFTLPSLPYAYDALEPYIDARTMELHHLKHHQAYIDNANRALVEFPEWRRKTAEDLLRNLPALPENIRTVVRNQVGGHVNHSLWWQVVGPRSRSSMPTGPLAVAVDQAFGSFEAFQTRFTALAMRRFGSGWAWLVTRSNGRLEVLSTANQDSPLSEGWTPLLGLDVWEHAYYLQYQERRADYVTAFWQVVNWRQVESNFVMTTQG